MGWKPIEDLILQFDKDRIKEDVEIHTRKNDSLRSNSTYNQNEESSSHGGLTSNK